MVENSCTMITRRRLFVMSVKSLDITSQNVQILKREKRRKEKKKEEISKEKELYVHLRGSRFF